MGIRVEFWEVPAGDIQAAIMQDFEILKDWYVSIGNEFPEEINYGLLEALEGVSESAKLFKQLDPDLIEELIDLYLGDFYDTSHASKREVKDTTALNIRNYQADFEPIRRKCPAEIILLWEAIMHGRPFASPDYFARSGDEFRYCFLTEKECQLLQTGLAEAFPIPTAEAFNRNPGIGSVLQAIQHKKGEGLLITVA